MRSLRPIEKNYEIVTLEIEKENLVRRYNKIRISVKLYLRFFMLYLK